MFDLLYDLGIALFGISQLPGQLRKRKVRPLRSWVGSAIPFGDPRRLRIWVHAVSVGEAKAVAPLIQRMRERLPHAELLVSSVTATGHEEVRRLLPGVTHAVYLPLDIGPVMRRVLSRFRPDLVVLSETDYWYRFLSQAKRQGSRIVVVNGKVSERSFAGYRRLPSLKRRLFLLPDHFCVQEELFRKRLLALGVESGRITVTGNLKLEAPPVRLSREEFALLRAALGERSLVVIGSTHEGEEELLVSQIQKLLAVWPDLAVAVVPRHPERFDRVEQTLRRAGLEPQRFSRHSIGGRIILVDAMGVLTNLYQVASVAIVAGSFRRGIGGHNILEPLWFGVPVLFGPHMESQLALRDLVERFEAGEAVEGSRLAEAVGQLLSDKQLYQKRVRASQGLLTSVRGCLDRTWSRLEAFFPIEGKGDGVLGSSLD